MTLYAAYGRDGTLGLRATTWELKIHQLNFVNSQTSVIELDIGYRVNSSLSDDTAVSIAPLITDAPPATATARYGSISLSGTYHVVASTAIDASSQYVGNVNNAGQSYAAGALTYTPPLDLTIAPGDVLTVETLLEGYTSCAIYFEELRLSHSY